MNTIVAKIQFERMLFSSFINYNFCFKSTLTPKNKFYNYVNV